LILLFIITIKSDIKLNAIEIIPEQQIQIVSEKKKEEKININNTENIEEIKTNLIKNEILDMWNTWYLKQDNWTKKKLIIPKQHWLEYATYLVNSIKKYQIENVVYNEWNHKTTQLPENANVHLLLASIAIHESNIDNRSIGKLKEIGILQCHPQWCLIRLPLLSKLPYRKRIEKAKQEPKLNIEAAVKHFTIMYGICNTIIKKSDDWLGSVSLYVAGSKAYKNNKCITNNPAQRRVNSMKTYLKNIEK
jgi:hypothetical protein